jgi:hypothetical protein
VGVVQRVRHGNHPFIKAIIAGLIAADEENRGSARIKSEERPKRTPSGLRTKFFHVWMPRVFYRIHSRPPERRADSPEQFHATSNGILINFV